MDAIAYDGRLSSTITGTVPVPEDRFEKVLGENAFHVWQILCAHRDAQGMTTITYGGMQRTKQFTHLNTKQIERALKRLRKSGLVRDLVRCRIKMERPVGRQGKTAVVWAFPRIVFGCRGISSTGAIVLVPGWVWGWIKTAVRRGGARKGAGRPQNRVEKEFKLGGIKNNQSGVPIYIHSNGLQSSRRNVAFRAAHETPHGVFDAVLPNFPAHSNPAQESAILKAESSADDPARRSVILETASSSPARAELGSKLGGSRKRQPPPPGVNGVPPYPGPTVCPPALVPPPLELPDDVQGLDAAWWLAKAFRGAVESRYKKRCWVLPSVVKLEKSKYLKLLVEAAELLRDYMAPPAAWASFSVDLWRKHEIGKGQPRLNWVYSLKRIEEQHSWGRREGYISRRAIYPKAAQVLMVRYRCMRVALADVGAQTRQEVQSVVEQWFPDGLYERLGRAARERAADDQRRINAAAARGDWMGW